MQPEVFSTLVAQAQGSADLINDLARTPLSQVVKFVAVLTVVRLALYPFLKNTPPHRRTGLYTMARVVNEILDAFIYAGVFVFMIIRPFFLQTFKIPSGSMWPTLHVNDYIVANKLIYRYSEPQFGDIVVFRPPVDATEGHPEQRDENGEVKVDFIKRLVGLPGDVVELRKGVLYRNGQPTGERFRHYSECSRYVGLGNCVDFRALGAEELADRTLANFKLVEHDGKVIPLNYTDFDANAPSPRAMHHGEPYPYNVASKYVLHDPEAAERLVKQPPAKIPAGYYLFMGDNRNNSFDGRGWGLVPRDAIIGRSELIWLPLNRLQVTR